MTIKKDVPNTPEQISEQQKNDDCKQRRIRRLIKAGVSKRLINKTFNDYFAKTKEQLYAKSRCEALANDLLEGRPTGSLIMNGGVGTGKTALSAAIANRLVDNMSVRIRKTIDLMRELKSTWSKDNQETEQGLIRAYSNVDLLVIDEIGLQFGSDTERLFLFDIIDGRYNEVKPTILISNLGMDEIEKIVGSRIIDRLREDGGKLIPFDWESYRK